MSAMQASNFRTPQAFGRRIVSAVAGPIHQRAHAVGFLRVLVTGIFNANAISYASLRIAGFQGSAILALGGTAGDSLVDRQYSASLNYTYGPFLISAAMHDGNAGGTAASTLCCQAPWHSRVVRSARAISTTT